VQNAFRVGESHLIEPSLNSVTGPAGTVRLEPKVMQVLVCLAAHAGEVVAKEHLIRTVWPDTFVTDDVLTRSISELRRVFGDDAKEPRVIQTILKSGYRLIAQVSPDDTEQRVATLGQTARIGTADKDDGGVVAPFPAGRASARVQSRWRAWTLGLLAIGLVVVISLGVLVLGWLAPAPRITIAVLPFEHLGGDPEREYLTTGLTEETSASLGQIDPEHFSVKGRTSTRGYKGTRKSLAEIGRELGVDYLVEGSVQAESSRLRVTAKLIRVRDQVQIWAESYNDKPESLLELQRLLSTSIARQIRQRLSPDRLTALAGRQTRNLDAYDLYIRGRHMWNQLTPRTNRLAVDYYVRATKLDPEYALAWAGLADAYSAMPINSDARPRDIADHARDAGERAVALGPDLAETHTALGTVRYWLDWDWPAAEAEYRKAIAFDYSYSQAHRVLGIELVSTGRHEEARRQMSQARELDPFNPVEHALSANVEFHAHNYAAGLKLAQQAKTIDATFWIGLFQIGLIHERLGNYELALDALREAERSSGNSKMLSLRGYILAKMGRTTDAEEVLNTLNGIAGDRYVPPYAMALVHAGLGQTDQVFAWLDKAVNERDVHLAWLVQDPKWDPYRKDPRFRALVERCNFMRTSPAS
jgi:TolB-like protein/DNA-binding winged helix-turn-helix (wHTH) protein/Tfp pilus assembly protein PilF